MSKYRLPETNRHTVAFVCQRRLNIQKNLRLFHSLLWISQSYLFRNYFFYSANVQTEISRQIYSPIRMNRLNYPSFLSFSSWKYHYTYLKINWDPNILESYRLVVTAGKNIQIRTVESLIGVFRAQDLGRGHLAVNEFDYLMATRNKLKYFLFNRIQV